jgi:tetratricopeptide (TPR) repeat protein
MSDEGLLSSWKEIADYLGCDVKTCARWEKESGLPIRRINPGSKRSRVFAYKAELDRWLAERNAVESLDSTKGASKPAYRRPVFLASAAVFLLGIPVAWLLSSKLFYSPPPVIAVREIASFGLPAEERYLAKELTEDIIRRLEFGEQVRIQRISEAAAANGSGQEAASNMPKVDYVFEAKLRSIGEKFSLAVNLKNVPTGRQVYADTITASPGEFGLRLNSVCEEIRKRIPEATGPRTSEGSMLQGQGYVDFLKGGFVLRTIENQDTDPLSLYNQGIRFVSLGNADTNEIAMAFFNRALQADSSFAPAYLGLAQCYSNYVNFEGRYDPKWLDKAESLLAEAQSRKPDQAEYFVLRIKALLLREIVFGGDYSREYFALAEKALALHPYYGRLHYVLGLCYYRLFEREGRESDFDTALHHYYIAWTADPAGLSNLNYAGMLMLRRQYDQALVVTGGVLDGTSTDMSAFSRGEIFYFRGDLDGSLAEFRKCSTPLFAKIAALYYEAMIAARRGDRVLAMNVLHRIERLEPRKEPISLDHLRTASIYAGLGDLEKASALLRQGFAALGSQGRYIMARYVELDPNFGRLSSNFVAGRMVTRNTLSIGRR